MGKGTFRSTIKGKALPTGVDNNVDNPKSQRAIYTDDSVARALGIRRRHLAAAKTRQTRGKDWDVIGARSGMTTEWIDRQIKERFPSLGALRERLEEIKPGSGVVTCTVKSKWPNTQKISVATADGAVRIATVRDSREFYTGETFDARETNGELYWEQRLNTMEY